MRAAALVCAALVACVALAEVGLRVAGYSAPQWYQPDPQLGWSLRAHKHGWHASAAGLARIDINAAGFRDREHFLDKPAGAYRIAVLGDEHSEAMHLPLNQTWWWRLAPALQACQFGELRGRDVEVLNFGVGGYGSAQQLVLLESTAMRYQPDLVLLQFSNGDDVVDNSFALSKAKERPFYLLDSRGVARIDESFNSSPAFSRRMQTRYRLAAEIADHSRAWQLGRQLAALAMVSEAHAGDDAAALQEPRDVVWEDAWRVTEAVIAKMASYTRRNGARLALVNVPHPRQRGEGMSYPDQRLAALGKQLDVRVIPAGDALASPEGHGLAAARIARELCVPE